MAPIRTISTTLEDHRLFGQREVPGFEKHTPPPVYRSSQVECVPEILSTVWCLYHV
jgi:hypothetical protein